jgi:cell division transport system ATP-binding protein
MLLFQKFNFDLANELYYFYQINEKHMSQPVLALRNATIFQDERTILNNVNLEVQQGEFLYIIGKTGSGKSSLMKTLYADLPLKEGEASIVGYDLAHLKESQIPFLRRKIGIVFQDFKLLPDRSLHENMLFVLKATGWTDAREMEAKIDEVLERVDLKQFAKKMPHQLSGGEQQRVAIARALLNDPELILADEPTGNLDPQTSVEVMETLRRINANGKTVIMATHDYALIMKFPSKTLKLENASLFEVVQRTV